MDIQINCVCTREFWIHILYLECGNVANGEGCGYLGNKYDEVYYYYLNAKKVFQQEGIRRSPKF